MGKSSLLELSLSAFEMEGLFASLRQVMRPARQIVGRELHGYLVAGKDADEVHPQFSGDVRQDAGGRWEARPGTWRWDSASTIVPSTSMTSFFGQTG